MKKNLLQLPDPDSFYCTVWMYRVHLPTLLIRVHEPEHEPFVSISFTAPSYFEGSMSWKGASFDIASDDERNSLLRQLRPVEENRSPLPWKLYIVQSVIDGVPPDQCPTIRILALDYSISTQNYKIGDFFS